VPAFQPVEIEAPPHIPRATGLFQSFPPTVMSSDKEADGSFWEQPSCDGPDPHAQVRCPTTPEERVAKRDGQKPYLTVENCLAVTLIGGVSCQTVGNLAHPNYQDEALYRVGADKLRRGAAYALGQMMSTGKAWQMVLDDEGCWTGEYEEAFELEDCTTGEAAAPFCLPDPIIPCADAVSPHALISNFEGRIGDCTTGQPVIYLPTAAAAFMVTQGGPVIKIGNSHFTAGLMTPVVFGYGFRGYSPTCEEPEDGTGWGFMRGISRINRSGDYDTQGGNLPTGIRKDSNERRFWVEEDFTVAYDPCCGVAQMMEFC